MQASRAFPVEFTSTQAFGMLVRPVQRPVGLLQASGAALESMAANDAVAPQLVARRNPPTSSGQEVASLAHPSPLSGHERTCPVPAGIRRGGLGTAFSLLLHAGVAAAAILMLPVPPVADIARGGDGEAMDVVFVGHVDSDASIEGAKAEPASLVLPELPPVEQPVVPPLPIEQPPPEVPAAVIEATPPAEPELALPDPVPALNAELLVAPKLAPPQRRIEPPVPPAPPVATKAKPIERPKPMARRMPEKRPPEATREARQKTQPVPSATARGETGTGESAASRQASRRAGTGGGGPLAGSGQMTNYGGRVRAMIERAKIYPEQALDRGITGRTTIALTIGRDGRVSAASVAKSSGHSLLDAATLAAVRRAQPFPPMPENGPAAMTYTVLISYGLRE